MCRVGFCRFAGLLRAPWKSQMAEASSDCELLQIVCAHLLHLLIDNFIILFGFIH